MNRLKVKTLADIEAFEKVPIEERLEFTTTYELIQQASARSPKEVAIRFFASGDNFKYPLKITYARFFKQIKRTANLFYDLGIGATDVVSYLLPNLPETLYVLWGGEAAGIVNPINYMLEAATIREICEAAQTKVLVVLGETPGFDIWEKALAIRDHLPQLKALVRVAVPGVEYDPMEGVHDYSQVIDSYNGQTLDSGRVIAPADVASYYHTGGTTGTPKLAPHTHYNEAAMAFMASSASNLEPGETTMCGLPLFHVNGTTVTGSSAFCVGAQVVILGISGYRDPAVMKNFYRIVEYYKAVSFSAVPTILSVLLDIPKGNADISTLRYLGCGAAPLSVELFKRFEAHSGMKILEGYGLTEGTCVSSLNPYHGERKIGSIGLRMPYQDMRVFIVDDDGRFVREAETDEIGAVCIRGPNVFGGYIGDVHNKGIWPKAGWFNTGDLGRQDGDGYVWLTGRKKELIIRGGHNIDPAAIEEPLYRLPGIKLAAAVGQPDPHAGELPVAYVQLQKDSQLTAEEILKHLQKEMGERAAIPKEIFIVDHIPLTPVGKIFKPALRWEATKQVYAAELRSLSIKAKNIAVDVKEDKVHGVLATITMVAEPGAAIADIEEEVKKALARYTVKYRLRIC